MLKNGLEEIKTKYGELIKSMKYWDLYLAPSQTYIGTSVLALKRVCIGLRDIKPNEWEEFNILTNVIENSLIESFNTTLFNWSCASNSAFRDNKSEPQVHWHIHPRYKENVFFEGMEFVDKEFGYAPRPKNDEIPKKIRLKIVEIIQKNLKIEKIEEVRK